MPAPRENSLNDVRAIIPPVCYERSRLRATRALIQATVLYAVPTQDITAEVEQAFDAKGHKKDKK